MADPGDRYAPCIERIVASVSDSSGHTGSELRQAVLARAARLAGRRVGPGSASDGVPATLVGYVDKVARHAYQVTDEDVAALQRSGSSDDAIFEITVASALGAALGRLECGLDALRPHPPKHER